MSASGQGWVFGVLALALCAGGCATGYQPMGFAGGYDDTRLAPDFFRVSFDGNQHTSMTRAQDFALLRAAELTLANGYTHFAIVRESEQIRVDTEVTPASTETTWETTGKGDHKTSTLTTTYVPAEVYYVSKPRSGLLIRCFKGKPAEPETFDAAYLHRTIRAKYKLN